MLSHTHAHTTHQRIFSTGTGSTLRPQVSYCWWCGRLQIKNKQEQTLEEFFTLPTILCHDVNEQNQITKKVLTQMHSFVFLTRTMAFTHLCAPYESMVLIKLAGILFYAPCSCGLTWHHHPAPVDVETWSHSRKADREEHGWWEIDCRIKKEKVERNYRQTKRKCVGEIQTRRWRLLDILLLEPRAFSESAWSKEGKLEKIIEWK